MLVAFPLAVQIVRRYPSELVLEVDGIPGDAPTSASDEDDGRQEEA